MNRWDEIDRHCETTYADLTKVTSVHSLDLEHALSLSLSLCRIHLYIKLLPDDITSSFSLQVIGIGVGSSSTQLYSRTTDDVVSR